MTVAQDFHADPHAFLQAHVVIQGVANIWAGFQEGDLVQVTVAEVANAMVHRQPYKKVCSMRRVVAGDPLGINAYWLPYQQNDIKSTMLGNLAGFMFTPTMDGCSLGIGSNAGNGVRRVSHVNMARSGTALSPDMPTPEAMAQQRKMQRNVLLSEHNMAATVIDPTQYQTWDVGGAVESAIKTTTWGLRTPHNDWQFYVQSYQKIGTGRFDWRGVRQVF